MKIYEKLFRLQQKLKVEKSKRNNFSGYNFRSAEQILETVKPLLNEEGCVLISSDEIKCVGEYNYIFTTIKLVDKEDGEFIEVKSNAREDKNAKGLCSSQMTGVSSSYSKKYALQNMFCIDNSRDADSDEIMISIFKSKIDECNTKNELMNIWRELNDQQQKALKEYFTNKKNML